MYTPEALYKENSREQRLQDAKHKQVLQNTKQWKEKIIPNWAGYKSSRKVKDLCRKGVPPSLRGRVWSLLIGQASYKISEEYFQQLVNVADLLYMEAAEREETLDSQYRLSEQERRLEELQHLQAMAINQSDNDEQEGNIYNEDSFYTAKGDSSVDDLRQTQLEDADDDCDGARSVDSGSEGSDSVHGISENTFKENKKDELRAREEDAVSGNGIDSSGDSTKEDYIMKMEPDIDEVEVEDEDSDDDGFVHEEEVLVSLNHQFKDKSLDGNLKTDELEDTTKGGHSPSADSVDVDVFVNRTALYDINDNDVNRITLNQMSEYKAGISDVKNHLMSIERDLPRTFPTLAFFHDGGPLELSLRRVLRAFVCFKTSIGYVQGFSFIVAMLLLYMDEVQAFRCLVNLLDKRVGVGRGFYKLEPDAVKHFVNVFDEYFKSKLPRLYQHMASEQISSEMFLIDWNLTLFSKSLSLESAARVWDCYLCEGEVFIIKASLGILKCLSRKIRETEFESILPLLIHVDVSTETLMETIGQIRVSNSTYQVKLGYELSQTSYFRNIGSRIKEHLVSQFSSANSPNIIDRKSPSISTSGSGNTTPTASYTPASPTMTPVASRSNSSDHGSENKLQSKLRSLFRFS